MIGNVEDENSERDAKAWNAREKFWQSSLASSFIYPNDPPRALLYGENDGYLVVRRDTRGKMVVQPNIAHKLHLKVICFYFLQLFRVYAGCQVCN
jgi:hypothetical protein